MHRSESVTASIQEELSTVLPLWTSLLRELHSPILSIWKSTNSHFVEDLLKRVATITDVGIIQHDNVNIVVSRRKFSMELDDQHWGTWRLFLVGSTCIKWQHFNKEHFVKGSQHVQQKQIQLLYVRSGRSELSSSANRSEQPRMFWFNGSSGATICVPRRLLPTTTQPAIPFCSLKSWTSIERSSYEELWLPHNRYNSQPERVVSAGWRAPTRQ